MGLSSLLLLCACVRLDGLQAPQRRASPRAVARSARSEAAVLRDEVALLELQASVGRLRLVVNAEQKVVDRLQREDDERESVYEAQKATARSMKTGRRGRSGFPADSRLAAVKNTVFKEVLEAPEIRLFLVNDDRNTRARVTAALVDAAGLSQADAASVTQKTHKKGSALIGTYQNARLDDAVKTYAALEAGGLEVRLEAATVDDVESDEELRELSRRLKEDLGVDITDSDGELKPAVVFAFNVLVALLTVAALAVTWAIGEDIGSAAGRAAQDLSGFSGGKDTLGF
ncbi:hypothetical protein M885DRAFT_507875 [Pelagophyceae sp. CCMP2097]|nr:hypothetical protein M885DRAFT_507875 [Pelagophyceae sp. CCMP2097]